MDGRLLLVEDDENLGYILKEYLEMNEFAVDWAKDGEEGLSEVKSNEYDLCILDIMMPKKDGFTLAKEIKELNKELPFIFLTAKTLKVDKLKGFDIIRVDHRYRHAVSNLFHKLADNLSVSSFRLFCYVSFVLQELFLKGADYRTGKRGAF